MGRSQTVSRRDGAGANRHISIPAGYVQPGSPSPVWSPDFSQLPTPNEQPEYYGEEVPMSSGQYASSAGKTSSDSGQGNALDRWSQRRLQRLNTEQGFREQRQGGGQAVLSPPASTSEQGSYISAGASSYPAQDTQPPQPPLHQPSQPHPTQQGPYQTLRTAQAGNPNAGLPIQTQLVSDSFMFVKMPAY